MPDAWKKLRHRLEWAALSPAVKSLPALSRNGVRRLAWSLGSAVWMLDSRSRTVALANLQAAFGSKYSDSDRKRIGRQSMVNFATTMLDLFWTGGRDSSRWKQYTGVEGVEYFRQARDFKGGTIIVTQHLGNWEWMNFVTNDQGLDMRVIAQEFKNPLIGPLFDQARTASGNVMFPRSGVMVRFLKHIKGGGTAAMLTDLTLRPEQPSVVIDCFGLKTCVTSMHAELQRRLECLLLPVLGLPQADGRLVARAFKPMEPSMDTPAKDVAQACWDIAEAQIRERPELWLWTYKHWRYLPEKRDREYPFYANPSRAFEKRLRGEK